MKISVFFASLLYVKLQLYVHIAGVRLNVNTQTVKTDAFKRGTVNAIGDFKEVFNSTTFVDKTLMIEEFFKNSGFRQYHLITCPHKFGKTTNLDMMRRFVEGGVKLSKNNEIYPVCDSQDLELFHTLHKKLNIAPLLHNTSDFYRDNFQQYSTIYVSFKVTGAKTFDEVKNALRRNFNRCFERYSPLYKINSLPRISSDGAEVDDLVNSSDGAEVDDLVKGLFNLSETLATHYPYKKIFLFVDDYDDPIIHAIEYNFDVWEVNQLIDSIFSELFNHHHRNIQQALITGTLNVFDKHKFSFIRHWSFLDNHHFAGYFGLTEDEVDQLLDSHGTDKEHKDIVKRYYDAYNVFRTSMPIYNLYSITNYLANGSPKDPRHGLKNYWTEASPVHNFWQSFKTNEPFGELLNCLLTLDKVTFPLKEHWSPEDLKELKIITHESGTELTDYRTDLILSYLFHNGFISYANETNTYRVPDNVEIRARLNCSCAGSGELSILDKEAIRAKLTRRF